MELGDRIKIYEKENEKNILPYHNFILRLDGKNFSKFTNGLKKPFDKNFTDAMVLTMNDLVNKLKPKTGYTHSDEITLIFSKVCTKEEYENEENKSVHIYNGRYDKTVEINGNQKTTRRSRFVNYCFKINEIDNPLELCLDKYWNNTETFYSY